MVIIRPLPSIDAALLEHLITGYTSTEVYRVTREETPDAISFELRLAQLEQPFVKCYPPLVSAELQRYCDLAAVGQVFGAFEGETCVGIAVCEPQRWNSSLAIWEFHIAPKFRRQGVGRALMSAVEAHTRNEGWSRIVCETQTTNVPTIRFYRALGFTVDAVDVSLYADDDIVRGEVAVFMRKRITHSLLDEASVFHGDE